MSKHIEKAKIPSIDIIVVNYNSTNCLIKCLESVLLHLNGYQTNIFVEDNETNGSIGAVEARFDKVRIQKNIENIGFGAAINSALKKGESPYVVILNPDTSLPDHSLVSAIEFLEINKGIGIVGPRIYEQDGSIQGSARRFPTLLTSVFGRKSPFTKIFPNNPITKKEFLCFNCVNNKEIDVDWVSGACMIVRREAIQQIDGFDERFFLYWEDTDLCKRLKNAGWRVVYFPSACVVHLVGQSSSQKPFFSTLHFHRSCYYLFKKHVKPSLRMITPIVFMGLAIRALFVICLHLTNRIINHKRHTEIKKRKYADNNCCIIKETKKLKKNINDNEEYKIFRAGLLACLSTYATAIIDRKNCKYEYDNTKDVVEHQEFKNRE